MKRVGGGGGRISVDGGVLDRCAVVRMPGPVDHCEAIPDIDWREFLRVIFSRCTAQPLPLRMEPPLPLSPTKPAVPQASAVSVAS